MKDEKWTGVQREILGLKNMVNELQVVISQMGRDMTLMQRKIDGVEIATNVNGARTFMNHITKKGNTKERRMQQ